MSHSQKVLHVRQRVTGLRLQDYLDNLKKYFSFFVDLDCLNLAAYSCILQNKCPKTIRRSFKNNSLAIQAAVVSYIRLFSVVSEK